MSRKSTICSLCIGKHVRKSIKSRFRVSSLFLIPLEGQSSTANFTLCRRAFLSMGTFFIRATRRAYAATSAALRRGARRASSERQKAHRTYTRSSEVRRLVPRTISAFPTFPTKFEKRPTSTAPGQQFPSTSAPRNPTLAHHKKNSLDSLLDSR